MDVKALTEKLTTLGISVGGKLLAALILWIVGRWLISLARKLVDRAMVARKVDPTLIRYADSTLGVVLNVVLVVAILGYFGIETTSFAAILAAGGVAIGMAWSGLLANFAAGAFMIILRPFKAGDFVEAGEVTGTVDNIGLFVTTIHTLDNVQTLVGNGKIFGGTIKNYSATQYRRVDLLAQLDHTVDHREVVKSLKAKLGAIPNVVAEPAPEVDILEFNLAGTVLAVRPYCNNEHYWQVYFDTNEAIKDAGAEASLPAPQTHYKLHKAA